MAEGSEYTAAQFKGKVTIDLDPESTRKFNFFNKFSSTIKRTFDSFSRGGSAFYGAMAAIAQLGSQGMQTLLGSLKSLFGALMDVILAPLFPEIVKWIKLFAEFIKLVRQKGLLGALTDMGFWDKVWTLAKSQIIAAWKVVQPLLELVWEKLKTWFFETFLPWLGETLLKAFLWLVGKVWEWLLSIPGTLWDWTVKTVTKLGEWGGELLSGLWEHLSAFFRHLPENLGKILGFIVGAAAGLLTRIVQGLWNFGTWLGNKLVEFIQWLPKLPGLIWDGIKGLADMIWDVIKDLPSLIMNGLAALPGLIWDGIKGIGGLIADAIRGIFGGVADFGGGFVDGVKSGWNAATGWI